MQLIKYLYHLGTDCIFIKFYWRQLVGILFVFEQFWVYRGEICIYSGINSYIFRNQLGIYSESTYIYLGINSYIIYSGINLYIVVN